MVLTEPNIVSDVKCCGDGESERIVTDGYQGTGMVVGIVRKIEGFVYSHAA